MAELSSRSRNALADRVFGLPGSRKYPMPNRNHAKNALARASQQYKAGRLNASEKAKIDAKAHRILGKKKSGM